MKTKRFFLFVGSVLIISLMLVACGGDSTTEEETSSPEPAATEVADTEVEESSGEPFRVAAVLPGTSNDFGISQGVYEALINIQGEMGEDNFEVAFSESMFVIDDAAAAIRDYASEGYDMVIAASSAFGSSIEEIAPDFPGTSFVWGTNPETFGLDNVYAFSVNADQGAYVGGIMAGMLSDQTAFVGPIYVGSIAASFDGFKAGVLAANPGAEVRENFTGSFSDVALAGEAARTMVDAGVTVLASQTEMGTGVAGVAEQEEGVIFFGNDADFAPFAPQATYASQVFRYGVALQQMIDQIKGGQLGNEVIWLSLDNGGTEVVFNPDYPLPDDVKAAAEETVQGIIDGSIEIPGVESAESSDGEEASGEPFRVAAVLPGTSNDFGISQGVYEALISIQEEMGEDNFEVAFSESMFVIDDAAAAIRDYASEGYDMVIAASSAFGSSIEEIAPDFPATSFVWGTNPETFGLDNVYAFSVEADQGAYVGGIMAGMLADQTAFVGPIYVGSIAASFDGFKAGVLAANPGAEVRENFTGSFSDVALAGEAARTMVDAGVTVLASQTEMGTGVAGVAEQEEGVIFFGNDADFAPFAPQATYASQVFRYGVALRQMIDQIKDDQLGNEVIWLSLDNGGTEVVFNPDYPLPDDVRAAAEETVQGIIDGSIEIPSQ